VSSSSRASVYKAYRLSLLTLTLLVLSPLSARAQTAAPPTDAAPAQPQAASPAAAPAPSEEAPAAPPAPATATVELSTKVDEADQVARIAARKVELLEEQLAAASKAAPIVVADDKGFGLRSADGAFALRIGGQLQADTRWFLDDDALSDRDTFLIRRFRPQIAGTLFGLADFLFVPDFAGSQTVVFDAYADVHPAPFLRLRAGKFKTPLGLERLQADVDLPLMERALTQNLTPTRDVGAALWGEIAGAVLTYSLGVYNGAADGANTDLDASHAKDFVFRVLVQPFKAEALKGLGALGLHAAYSQGDRKGLPPLNGAAANPLLPSFRSAGQNSFFSYLAPSSDPTGTGTVFAHLTQTRFNPGLFYYLGGFGALGEVVWSRQEVQKGNTIATLTHRAAHATVSYVFGGKNGYSGPTPTRSFDLRAGAPGALEVALRWNRLDIDEATFPTFADPGKSARSAQGFAVGANYVPHRMLHLSANYEATSFSGGKGTGDRNTEKFLGGRAQLNF